VFRSPRQHDIAAFTGITLSRQSASPPAQYIHKSASSGHAGPRGEKFWQQYCHEKPRALTVRISHVIDPKASREISG
jgi:hypothetical protein